MSGQQTVEGSRAQRPGSAEAGQVRPTGGVAPTWWVVFLRELTDLWIGGRALTLLFLYSVLLGVQTYVMATNSELSLIPPKEIVYETVKVAIAVSIFIGLIIGSDSISGERERATLESLLLTPTNRGQIMLGKFLAGISPWPVALLLTIPYMMALAQGDEVLWPAVLWGAILGSVLAPAYTGLGMLVSFFSGTNRTSFFVSLGLYILFLVPAQLPGTAQTGAAGQFLQWVNPMAASSHFLSKHLVNYRSLAEFWTWLISPFAFLLLVLAVLFLYAGPGLRLDPGRAGRLWSRLGRSAGLLIAAGLIQAQGAHSALASPAQQPSSGQVQIDIDKDYMVVKTGDRVDFITQVTNTGAEPTNPVIVAMNVINLDSEGDVVDPEDWSPERTQYIESLAPSEVAEQAWIINTILEGDYMVYMVALPEPSSTESTSQAVSSSGIHLTVTPFTRLNPVGILPYVIGGPALMFACILVIYQLRRRQIDQGDS
jgi:hypothetical protein